MPLHSILSLFIWFYVLNYYFWDMDVSTNEGDIEEDYETGMEIIELR